jgi:hypothetical protein
MYSELGQTTNKVDEFAADFWDDKVIIKGKVYDAGQIATETLNISKDDNQKLLNLSVKLEKELMPFVDHNPVNDEAFLNIQNAINKMNEIIFKLPLYSKLELDFDFHNSFVKNMDDEQKKQVSTIGSEEYLKFMIFMKRFIAIPHEIINFQHMIFNLEHNALRRTKLKNESLYAYACMDFFTNLPFIKKIQDASPDPSIGQFTPSPQVEMVYAVSMHPEKDGELVFVERMYFESLMAFLAIDLFKALHFGHAPIKCKNCGRYFLNITGYNSVYCDGLDPKNPTLTCRQIGAKVAEKEKNSNNPAYREYKKAYRRVQTDCTRGNITVTEKRLVLDELLKIRLDARTKKWTDKQIIEAFKKEPLYRRLQIGQK